MKAHDDRGRLDGVDQGADAARARLPGVDLAVTPFPEMDTQRAQAQALLDPLIQPTLCYNTLTQRMELTLENVTAGHGFPSGATPDRRAWIELTAYARRAGHLSPAARRARDRSRARAIPTCG